MAQPEKMEAIIDTMKLTLDLDTVENLVKLKPKKEKVNPFQYAPPELTNSVIYATPSKRAEQTEAFIELVEYMLQKKVCS